MEVAVKLKNIRTSPRKIRPVLLIIRGKIAKDALDILKFTNKSCSYELYQLVKSGIAAAVEHEMNEENLIVKIAKCDEAQTLKRHRFKARGRTTRIQKRSSHLSITISDSAENKKIEKKETVTTNSDLQEKNTKTADIKKVKLDK